MTTAQPASVATIATAAADNGPSNSEPIMDSPAVSQHLERQIEFPVRTST